MRDAANAHGINEKSIATNIENNIRGFNIHMGSLGTVKTTQGDPNLDSPSLPWDILAHAVHSGFVSMSLHCSTPVKYQIVSFSAPALEVVYRLGNTQHQLVEQTPTPL